MDKITKHILVVDDEELVCTLLEDFLEDCGYRVSTATFGAKGLEMIKDDVDLAIVDMRLPDMEGKEFILKASEIVKDVHFFIHTGSLDYSIDDELGRLGLNQESIIYKPINDLFWLDKKISNIFK